MPMIKLDRDLLLERIYEIRSKIDPDTQKEILAKIEDLVELISQSDLAEITASYPKIKFAR